MGETENNKGIEIIFFKPHREYTYLYSVNGIENLKVIDRDKVVTMVPLEFCFVPQIRELTNEFKSFYVLFNPPTIEELEQDFVLEEWIEKVREAQDKELYKIMTRQNKNGKVSLTLPEKINTLQKTVKNRKSQFENLFRR